MTTKLFEKDECDPGAIGAWEWLKNHGISEPNEYIRVDRGDSVVYYFLPENEEELFSKVVFSCGVYEEIYSMTREEMNLELTIAVARWK